MKPIPARVTGAALGLGFGASLAASLQARRVVGLGAVWSEAFAAGFLAYLVIGLALLVPLAIIRKFVSLNRAHGTTEQVVFGIATVAMPLAVLVYLGYYEVSRRFASDGLRALALGLLTAAAATAGMLIVPAVRRTRPLQWLVSLRFRRALLPVMVVLWASCLVLFEIEAILSLRPERFLPSSLLAVVLTAASLWVPRRRGLRVAAAALLFSFAAASLGVLLNSSDRQVLYSRFVDAGGGAGLIMQRLRSKPRLQVMVPSDFVATCHKGVPLRMPGPVSEGEKPRPNIIFVTIDAARWDHTTVGGYRRDTTPGLAHWAEHAVVFENAFSPGASTRQTFRSLFSGMHRSVLGPQSETLGWAPYLRKSQPTLFEYLHAAGYSTVSVQSSGHFQPTKENGLLDGISIRDESPRERMRLGWAAEFQVDRIITHLSSPSDAPRFVWGHFFEPHHPYRYGPGTMEFGSEPIDRYDSALLWTDGALGRLLEFALAPERRDSTYVVVSADHGEGFGEHGSRWHGRRVNQEQTHVPLMIWGPGAKPRRVTDPVNVLDAMPTILEMAGIPAVEGLCGESLWPVASGAKPTITRPVFTEIVPDHKQTQFAVALTVWPYRLIIEPAIKRSTLFDLQRDPTEERDLIPHSPGLAAAMQDRMRRYIEGHNMIPADFGL